MATGNYGTLLTGTRWLIRILLGLAIFGAILSGILSVVLPFYWDDVVREMAQSHPQARPAGLAPLMLVLFAGIVVILGGAIEIGKKLLAIIQTVGEGDPFARANAKRLRMIGWILLGIQLISIPLGWLGTHIGNRLDEAVTSNDFSLSGLLAVLLAFVLAGVFEQGAAMREDLEGTV